MAAHHQTDLPTRSQTQSTAEEDAVPGEDTTETTKLFSERLDAWKHAVDYLSDYIESTEKIHHAHGKEYEKVLKTVSKPLKHGEHFDQSLGGVAGMFDNIRSNTQGISNSHYETEKSIKGQVLPVFERLHSEIKNKSKELLKGAGKGGKAVDKARKETQKHIELLGQHAATFDSHGGKLDAQHDPYVLQRGVYHRLNHQVIEENNNRQDLITVQNSFAQFESHVISTMQSGLSHFVQIVNQQSDHQRSLYSDILSTTQRVPLDFEWTAFVKRHQDLLIDPNQPPRSISNISFPNQNHRATQPLIAGSLEKKGKLLRKYDTFYYVVTPAKFLHEFKSDDDFHKEPAPEMSLYLPDCTVGGVDGVKFHVKGKDVSKGKVGNLISATHEFSFKAHTPQDAQQWQHILAKAAGQAGDFAPPSPPTGPSSPVESRHTSAAYPPSSAGTSGLDDKYAASMSGGAGGVEGAGHQPTTTTTTGLQTHGLKSGGDPHTGGSDYHTPNTATGAGSGPWADEKSGLQGKPGQY